MGNGGKRFAVILLNEKNKENDCYKLKPLDYKNGNYDYCDI
jgi:hypothetical protein